MCGVGGTVKAASFYPYHLHFIEWKWGLRRLRGFSEATKLAVIKLEFLDCQAVLLPCCLLPAPIQSFAIPWKHLSEEDRKVFVICVVVGWAQALVHAGKVLYHPASPGSLSPFVRVLRNMCPLILRGPGMGLASQQLFRTYLMGGWRECCFQINSENECRKQSGTYTIVWTYIKKKKKLSWIKFYFTLQLPQWSISRAEQTDTLTFMSLYLWKNIADVQTPTAGDRVS